jgi:tetraprenyl-beta-curcumene synthase
MAPDRVSPPSLGELQATSHAAFRELAWGLRLVRADQARRAARARRIRDPDVRADVLAALAAKRPVTNGAAFFWTLPRHRSRELHRLLLAFQTLANVLDVVSERDARERGEPPRPWARAIEDAVAPDGPERRSGGLADDGYVDALVAECRDGCRALPGFERARSIVARESVYAHALDVEHDPDVARRRTRLRRLAESRSEGGDGLSWFELTAGASSLLTILAPLALASDPGTSRSELEAAASAYRDVATVSALLDNYVDRVPDARTGANNYLDLYGSVDEAIERIGALIERSLAGVRALPDGDRHSVVVASMVAMFLTSRSVDGGAEPGARRLLEQAGPLARALVAPLTLWRRAHRVLDG